MNLIVSILAVSVMPVFAAEKSLVRETILPNGLKVLTKEVHAAPVVSFQVWYRVGSRNEELGKTGLSHLLEHMQFKGTKSLGKGEIDKLMRHNGAINNAATWKDFTYYWETLSNDKLDLAMRIESDRMVNSLIDPKEFNSEMVVVRSELEGHENQPDSLCFYELYADAFKAHPYEWPTIGWRHDVETISRDDLYRYYKNHYMPNNATVVIAGDFDTDKALAMVKKYFGDIPKGTLPPEVTALEPVQFGEKRAEIHKAGTAFRCLMGYHVPKMGDSDNYPLDVLGIVLGSGTSSRLYRSLVDKQLATDAYAEPMTSKDPDLFFIGATARVGVSIKEVESALLSEVERVKTAPITDEELQKAINQSEASFVYANDSVTHQAERLGEYETAYSWRYLDSYLDNIRKVTKADVQRVAQKYLIQDNRTVVTFVPAEESAGKASAGVPSTRPSHEYPAYKTASSVGESPVVKGSKDEVRGAPTRVVLDNGMTVIIQENRSNPTIAISGCMKAGGMFDPQGKDGLAEMTSQLLMKGTAKRTAEQIGAEKDFVGMTLQTGAEPEAATFGGNSLSKNFALMLDILSDTMRNASFPSQELEKLRSQRISNIKGLKEDPESLATIAFYGTVFPKGHPYYQPPVEEQLVDTAAITRDDVLGFYKSHYGPQNMVLVVVGDVDAKDAIEKIKSYFGDWQKTGPAATVNIPDISLQSALTKKIIPMADKSQVDVLVGYSAGLKRSDPDFYAANVMNFILGGSGAFGSRFGDLIRDNMGLAYNVYSMFNATAGAGPWVAELGTNPANADKAITTLVEQMKLMQEKGVTPSELKEAVNFLTGSFPVRLETNASIARVLYQSEFYGMGMNYIRDYSKIYRSVTLDQVNAAAKKYLHPDNYTLVIAGSYSAK